MNTWIHIFKHTHNIFTQLTVIKIALFLSPLQDPQEESRWPISSNSKNYYFASHENFDSTRNTWPATTFAIISTSFPISPWSRSEIKAEGEEGPATKVVVAEQKNDWHECGWREERKQILSMHLAVRRNRKARLGETEREKSCLEIPKPGGAERIELRDPGHKINRRIFISFCRPTTSSPLLCFLSTRSASFFSFIFTPCHLSRVNWSLGLMAATIFDNSLVNFIFFLPPPFFFFLLDIGIFYRSGVVCSCFLFVQWMVPVFARFVIPLQFSCDFSSSFEIEEWDSASLNSSINYNQRELLL